MAPLVDLGTDCEDELPIPAGPPAEVGQEKMSVNKNFQKLIPFYNNILSVMIACKQI